jgi:hypothetical protein
MAEVLYRGAPKGDAVRLLEELSTRFGREEQMEALLIMTFLEAEQEGVEVDADLIEEVGERFRSFPDRFPNSKVMWRVDAPATAEEFHELLREMHGDSAAAQRSVQDQIADGQGPVNALAVVSPVKEVGSAWARLSALPLGFAIPSLDDHERTIAAAAIGGAAVWDPSSLCTVGGLGYEIEQKIQAALPGSLIVNETLEDADSAASGPVRKEKGDTEIGYNPETERAFIEDIPAEESERQRLRVEGMLRLAKELNVQPGAGPGVDEALAQALDDDEMARPWKPFVGTVLLAQRTKRPIFSDDRWIRQFAREHGIEAFGTVAALDALADSAIITAEERYRARARLAASGGWGVGLNTAEMIDAARSSEWDLTSALAGAFRDRATWRGRPGERLREMIGFLYVAYQEAPETLGTWLRRMLDAAMQAVPHMHRSWWSQALLLLTWGLDDKTSPVSDAAFQALVEEVQSLPPYLTTLGTDPVLGAIAEMMSYFGDEPAEVRAFVLRRAIQRLRAPDQMRALQHFVSP